MKDRQFGEVLEEISSLTAIDLKVLFQPNSTKTVINLKYLIIIVIIITIIIITIVIIIKRII